MKKDVVVEGFVNYGCVNFNEDHPDSSGEYDCSEDVLILDCCATLGLEGFSTPKKWDRAVGKEVHQFSPEQSVMAFKALLKRAEVHAKKADRSMLVATTNDAQVEANQALEESGFSSTPWAVRPTPLLSNGKHRTKVKLWWKLTNP